MKRLLPLLLIVMIMVVFPTLVQADDQPASGGGAMDGMDMSGAGSGSPGDPGYKPVEVRASDGGMAMIVVLIFGFPVVIWLIVRTLKKSARSRRSVD